MRYWERVLSSPTGIHNELPDVILPEPCSRELRRIRLHDLVNVDTIFFVVTELQEVTHPSPVLRGKALISHLDFIFSSAELTFYYMETLIH